MALKFTDKLKDIEIPKVSMPNIFGKKADKENLDNTQVQEYLEAEVVDSNEVEQAKELASSTHELREKVLQFIEDNSEKLKKNFSESKLVEKVGKVAKKAGATIIYPVLLLFNLLKSPHTSSKDKMLIIASLAYFIMPADLIPDFILGLGFADDGLAIMTCIKTFATSITPEVKEQTKALCKDLIGEVDESVINNVSGVVTENQDAIMGIVAKASKNKKK